MTWWLGDLTFMRQKGTWIKIVERVPDLVYHTSSCVVYHLWVFYKQLAQFLLWAIWLLDGKTSSRFLFVPSHQIVYLDTTYTHIWRVRVKYTNYLELIHSLWNKRFIFISYTYRYSIKNHEYRCLSSCLFYSFLCFHCFGVNK